MLSAKNQMRLSLFRDMANYVAGSGWDPNDIADAVGQIVDRWMPEKPRNASGRFASLEAKQAAKDEAQYVRDQRIDPYRSFSDGVAR